MMNERMYLGPKEAGIFLSVSAQTIHRIKPEIEEWIKKGRYSQYAIADSKINKLVLVDYWKYRKPLAEKIPAKYVPPFNAEEVRKAIGVKEHNDYWEELEEWERENHR